MTPKDYLIGILLSMGIMTPLADLQSGMFWAAALYVMTTVIRKSEFNWRTLGGFIATIVAALFITFVRPGLPYIMDMPVQAAMGASGVVVACVFPTPIKLTTLTEILKAWKR